MSTLAKEIAFAARSLRKSPGFAVTAIVTLALGIGASTAIFSVVNAVLLRPLPYKEPERLAVVWDDLRNRNVTNFPFAAGDYRDLVEQVTAFEEFAAVNTGRAALNDDATKPEMVRFALATTNIFSLLGVPIAFGRNFAPSDGTPQPPAAPAQNAGQPGNARAPGGAAAQPVPRLPSIVILSHGFWERRYGSDSAVIGKSIQIGNNTGQIVGVLSPEMELLFSPKANLERVPDLWSALRINLDSGSRIDHGLRLIGRLKPGATIAEAQAQADRLGADLRQRFPIKNSSGMYIRVEPMKLDVVRTVQRPLVLLLGAVGFVLLIACANVANLLLVRASARERELAVRSALGGSRWALVRQMLTESLLLAGVGAVIGLVLAQAGIDLLAAIAPSNLPRLTGVKIDFVVLSFCILLSVLSAVVFGLVPALRASRPNIADILRGGRAASQFSGNALRNGVVVTEVALSFVLLVGSGLMLRSFVAVAGTDPGFEPSGLLTFELRNSRARSRVERDAFVQQMRTKLSGIPGVTGVTAASSLPLDGNDPNARWVIEAKAADEQAFRQAQIYFVHPGYFETMRTRIIAGRALEEGDIAAQQPPPPPNATPAQLQALQAAQQQIVVPIVVDEQLAQRAYPGENAVGKRILARLGGPTMSPFEIIGIARHQRHTSLVSDEREIIWFPDRPMNARWVVRSSRGVTNLLPQIRAAAAELDPMVPIADAKSMSDYVDRAMAPTRFALVMLAIFAAIAALLASVGLYGVLASAVRQRTAEIGVRMAFGAPSRSIFALVIGQGLRLSAIGVVIGLVGALALTGVLKTLLVGVTATDPLTFTSIAALFILVATLACWIPARRAAALDPNVALREE